MFMRDKCGLRSVFVQGLFQVLGWSLVFPSHFDIVVVGMIV